MTSKMLRLTYEESKNPSNTGYAFAIEHKDRWEDITGLGAELDTYDVSTTYVVKNETVYTIFKDYIILDEGVRLYIFKERNLSTDVPKKSDEDTSEDK